MTAIQLGCVVRQLLQKVQASLQALRQKPDQQLGTQAVSSSKRRPILQRQLEVDSM